MNIAAMFVLVVLAVMLWWLLLQKLKAKPWLEQGILIEPVGSTTWYPPQVIGLGVFIAVVTALFSLFAAAYHMRMMVPDWTHLPLPKLLWSNTALLALSSVALQWAWSASDRFLAMPADKASLNTLRQALIAGGCFALAFLAGQILAWRQLDANGFFFSCTPASAFFYLLTGLHGLHLLGGLLVWGKTTVKVYRGELAPHVTAVGPIALSIKLCAIYWHYLLLIWLAVYALFLFT